MTYTSSPGGQLGDAEPPVGPLRLDAIEGVDEHRTAVRLDPDRRSSPIVHVEGLGLHDTLHLEPVVGPSGLGLALSALLQDLHPHRRGATSSTFP